MDNVNGTSIPRFLIYDVIKFRGEETGKCDFRIRLSCIRVRTDFRFNVGIQNILYLCILFPYCNCDN